MAQQQSYEDVSSSSVPNDVESSQPAESAEEELEESEEESSGSYYSQSASGSRPARSRVSGNSRQSRQAGAGPGEDGAGAANGAEEELKLPDRGQQFEHQHRLLRAQQDGSLAIDDENMESNQVAHTDEEKKTFVIQETRLRKG